MATVKLSPVFQDEQLDNNGLPLSGGQLYWYFAGSSTPATTYTDSTGATPQANPIVLNTRGEPANPIWLPTGQAYKAVLQDSLGNPIRTIDNITGINDTSIQSLSEWVAFAGAATYINATSFSVTGDQTATFTKNRKVKATVSGGTYYGIITASSFAAGITTITVSADSISLDSGLSAISYALLDPSNPSLASLGYSQLYVDETPNRTIAASPGAGPFLYTNSTGRPIFVYFTGTNNTVSGAASFYAGGQWVGDTNEASRIGGRVTGGFIVPAGATYQVVQSTGTTSTTAWKEMKL